MSQHGWGNRSLWYTIITLNTQDDDFYFNRIAAAFVRGRVGETHSDALPSELSFTGKTLNDLDIDELQQIIQIGLDSGLRLHRFKQTMGLARVQRVLGVLHGLMPTNLLDIGSGRGAFLWPLLDEFPDLPITCIDTDPKRVTDINTVAKGGISHLSAQERDIINSGFDDNQFDIVTMLEVLEHIPDTTRALSEAVRIAKDFVVLSVPSHSDDNPEHIHLFTRERLTELLTDAGAAHVNTSAVLNHWIAVARVAR